MIISWGEGEDTSTEHLRVLQLGMRIKEVYEVHGSFKRFITHVDNESTNIMNLEGEQREEWISSFRDRIDFDNVYLAGHSFGGATMVNPRKPIDLVQADHDLVRSPPCSTSSRF